MAVGNRIPTRAGHLHQADVAAQPVVRNTSDDTAIRRPTNVKLWAILITTMIITLSRNIIASQVKFKLSLSFAGCEALTFSKFLDCKVCGYLVTLVQLPGPPTI